jgi:hypothetical protein
MKGIVNWLKEWFLRSTILPHKKEITFLLGFLAASLSLTSKLLDEVRVAEVFVSAFVLCLIVLLCVRPDPFKNVIFDKSRWAIFSIAVLGFGSGAFIFHYRGWLVWLWNELLKIHTNQQVLLTSLFLLGVIMGFFVVRNWSKDQKDFLASLSAVVGGAFLSSIIGEFAKDGTAQGGTGLARWLTFTYYFFGFTISGALNLLVFTFLTARYTSTQSAVSRAIIDFLYGSDKAKAIDGYFLRNFEDDLDYAKSALLSTLKAYREVIKVQLAGRLRSQWSEEEKREEKKHYFVLRAIEMQGKDQFVARFRELQKKEEIEPEMFRVAVSMRWQDTLEYVVAPGEYKKSFPYFGSVAGLALLSREIIVMDRDRLKKFRSEQYTSGKTPAEAQQPRGLNQIDYVSYIAIPLVINFGKQEETELGILHVDTKLCAASQLPKGATHDDYRDDSFFAVTRTREQLEKDLGDWGGGIYNVEDEIIECLKEMRAVVIPVLQLYKKCRTGAALLNL